MFIQRASCLALVFSANILLCAAQVVTFGKCVKVDTMQYFSMDNFLGKWYVIQRFPIWYENSGQCAYKRFLACGRRIRVEHSFVKDSIQYILQTNSTYAPGADAVLEFKENNVDPIGIPMTVVSTDYNNYALVYGCKYKEDLDLKFLSAWILSREPSLEDELLHKVRMELNSIPYASAGYLQAVAQDCSFHWTALVQAVNVTEDT